MYPQKIKLIEFDEWGSGNFQLHECGYIPNGCVWHFNQLCHPFWRFYHNSEMGNYIETGNQRIDIKPNEVMIIPENTLFNARSERDVPHLWIHFSPPLAFRIAEGQFCLPLEEPMAGNIRALKERLRTNPLSTLERHQAFHLCLAVLHSCFSMTSLKLKQPQPRPLTEVLETIERSLSRPPSNEDLARQAGMSRDGFIRWFKAHMKTTPASYVARRRIREACRILSLTDKTIEEIAEILGFSNRHHFTRLFIRHSGLGPAEFRRKSMFLPFSER